MMPDEEDLFEGEPRVSSGHLAWSLIQCWYWTDRVVGPAGMFEEAVESWG